MNIQGKEIATFDLFCQTCCDGLYDPKLPESEQCTGYIKLREMVIGRITPATLEEMERWENEPTEEELASVPDVKYLRFLHPILRPFIVNNWDEMLKLRTGKWRIK
jgi:hypothetical protein